MGSGSTGKAAVLKGFSFIGIEREAEYLVIAQARNVILIPQFGGIKQVVAEETDKENKPAVICLPPLVEYLDYVVFAETGNNLSGGCPFQDVETMSDKITRQVLLRLLKI